MRDDIKNLYTNLHTLLKQKLKLLNNFYLSEIDKIHYIQSDNLEKYTDLFRSDNYYIEEIDALDYSISEVKYMLSRALGIEKDDFLHFTKTICEDNQKNPAYNILHQTIMLIKSNEVKIKEISEQREEIQKLLEKSLQNTDKNIKELNDLYFYELSDFKDL